MDLLRRTTLKCCRSRLFTIFLMGILFMVIIFVLSSYINSSKSRASQINRGQHGNGWLHPGRHSREGKFQSDDDTTPFCDYNSKLVEDNVLEEEWKGIPGNCRDGKLLFFAKGGIIYPDHDALQEENLLLKKCEFTAAEWHSDESYVFTKTFTLDNLDENSQYFLAVKHDFVHVRCYLDAVSQEPSKGNKQKRSVERDDPVTATDSSKQKDLTEFKYQSSDAKEFQTNILQQNFPRIIGSLGMPDLRLEVLLAKQKELENQNSQDDIDLFLDLPIKRKGSNITKPTGKKRAIGQLKSGINSSDGTKRKSKIFLRADETSGLMVYDQFVVHVAEKDSTTEKLKWITGQPRSLQMNVLLLALDSISQKSFLLNFKKTREFFQGSRSVILHGYNVLGDSAIASILPLLTGIKDSELENLKRKGDGGQYISALPFIWNQFEQSGYVTLYAENQPLLGTFQHQFMGFEEPPVDHYMRPFWLATESKEHHFKEQGPYCIGSRPKHQYILDYIRHFFQQYQQIPKFAFGFVGDYEKSTNLDEDLFAFFNLLKAEGKLDDTLVILTGDHGTSYGIVRNTFGGMLNERLPLAILSFPETFLTNHQEFYNNVEINKARLTTAFDLHKTIQNLLDISPDEVTNEEERGISLFKEIPKDRTCQSADVSIHYCTCSKYDPNVQLDDHRVTSGVKKVLEDMNNLIGNKDGFKKCQKLSLEKIISAQLVIPNDLAYSFDTNIEAGWLLKNITGTYPDYVKSYLQIVFQTSPGSAIFEGTVSILAKPKKEFGSGDNDIGICRISGYNKESECISRTFPSISRFCYCYE